MSGRIYRIPFNATITAAGGDTDLFTIQPAAEKPCKIVGWIIGQFSEIGDAQEEVVRLTIRHMTATVTVTGGTSVTPVARRPGTNEWAAAGFTAKTNHTTVATTSGTSVVVEEFAWNLRNVPFERWIPEEMQIQAVNGEALLVRLETTLADDISFAGTLFVEEE